MAPLYPSKWSPQKSRVTPGPIWIHFIVSFHHFHHSFMELSTNQYVTKTGPPQGCSTLNPLHTLGISATCRLIGDDRLDSVGLGWMISSQASKLVPLSACIDAFAEAEELKVQLFLCFSMGWTDGLDFWNSLNSCCMRTILSSQGPDRHWGDLWCLMFHNKGWSRAIWGGFWWQGGQRERSQVWQMSGTQKSQPEEFEGSQRWWTSLIHE